MAALTMYEDSRPARRFTGKLCAELQSTAGKQAVALVVQEMLRVCQKCFCVCWAVELELQHKLGHVQQFLLRHRDSMKAAATK